jgi:hypothetical protein
MAETLKDVIAKIKQQQNSQAQQVKPAPAPNKEIPAPVEEEVEEIDEEEIEEIKTEQAKQVPKSEVREDPKEDKIREQIIMEIEMLQNNGRYRVELLHQLQEINKALVVIASCLANGKA